MIKYRILAEDSDSPKYDDSKQEFIDSTKIEIREVGDRKVLISITLNPEDE